MSLFHTDKVYIIILRDRKKIVAIIITRTRERENAKLIVGVNCYHVNCYKVIIFMSATPLQVCKFVIVIIHTYIYALCFKPEITDDDGGGKSERA